MKKVRISRPGGWKGGKSRSRKPLVIKGADWSVSGGDLTVYDKNNVPVLSLAQGRWTAVRPA